MREISRRSFFEASAMCIAAPLFIGCDHASANQLKIVAPTDTHASGLSIADVSGQSVSSIQVGNRGHDVAWHPLKQNVAIIFGRRPAFEAYEVDVIRQTVMSTIASNSHSNMQGHGFFSADGSELITVEMDNESAQGILVVRDSQNYQIKKTIPTYGIGPHEAHLMPDNKLAVVANGGLLTRPESGREIFNLDSMDSNLSYIELATGKLIEQVKVSEPSASIRHLDVNANGVVVAGMQLQASSRLPKVEYKTPLMLSHSIGQPVRLFDHPKLTPQMQNYVGSVKVAGDKDLVCCTTPKGDLAVFWQISTGQLQGYHSFADVCGLAYDDQTQEYVLSNSKGSLRFIETAFLSELKEKRIKFNNLKFDNHMIAVR